MPEGDARAPTKHVVCYICAVALQDAQNKCFHLVQILVSLQVDFENSVYVCVLGFTITSGLLGDWRHY